MDKRIAIGFILILLVAMVSFAFARDIEAVVNIPDVPQQIVLEGKSVAYYLKVLNKNLVEGISNTSSLIGKAVSNPVTAQDNACKTGVAVCPVGLKSKLSKNMDVASVNNSTVFVASLSPSTADKTSYIGQYFSIDLSDFDVDYSMGLGNTISKHSNYNFKLNLISGNGRFLFLNVTKPGEVALDCQNVKDWSTIKNELSSTWTSVKQNGWSNFWGLVPVYQYFYINSLTTGNLDPLDNALISYALKLDLSLDQYTLSCYDDQAPNPEGNRLPVLKLNFVKVDAPTKSGDPMKLYFTLSALKKRSASEYYDTLPGAADKYFTK